MKKIIFSMFLLVLLVSGYTVNGQAFWQGTEYGMTVAQVKKLFPDAYYGGDCPPPYKNMEGMYGRMVQRDDNDKYISEPLPPLVKPEPLLPLVKNFVIDPKDIRDYFFLKLENVNIVGTKFSVLFSFKNGLLDEVTLTSDYFNDYETLYRNIFLPMSDELSAKYGKSIGSDQEKKWTFGNTTVQLYIFFKSVVGISYKYSS